MEDQYSNSFVCQPVDSYNTTLFGVLEIEQPKYIFKDTDYKNMCKHNKLLHCVRFSEKDKKTKA